MKKRKQLPRFIYTLIDELCASPTRPLSEVKRTSQLAAMWSGLAALETGANPCRNDWAVCSDAVNLLETLVIDGHVEDSQGLLPDAITALAEAGKRSIKGLPLRLSGLGMQAVRAVLEDYSAMIEQLPARTMIRAHRLTERRIHGIHSGKKQAHDVEVVAL